MSRNILKEKGVSIEDLKHAYFKHQNAKAVGEEFGISQKSVLRLLTKAGIVIYHGRPVGEERGKPYHTSCLAEWLRANPGVKLPRSVEKIAELTGCTKDEVKTYLYRRRVAIARDTARLPFKQSTQGMKDTTGFYIPFAAWGKVLKVQVEPYTFALLMTVKLHSGHERQFRSPSLQSLSQALRQSPSAANHSSKELPRG